MLSSGEDDDENEDNSDETGKYLSLLNTKLNPNKGKMRFSSNTVPMDNSNNTLLDIEESFNDQLGLFNNSMQLPTNEIFMNELKDDDQKCDTPKFGDNE